MRTAARAFQVRVGAVGWTAPQTLSNGHHGHLSLREDGLWGVDPQRLVRDFVRICFAVYSADRLVRRPPPKSFLTPVRQIELTVEVGDPEFWREQTALIKQALQVLCDDIWDIQFVQGPPVYRQLPLIPRTSPPTVWQHSGGLDSAAGAVIRAAEVTGPVVTVTAMHQTHQAARVTRQLDKIEKRFGRDIEISVARTTFGPLMLKLYPRFDYQEPTQRCRAFMFMACGGATASAIEAERVEVLENGVGVINLPLMAGMAFGSRTTCGCHPQFLRLMSKLASRVAGRPIEYLLPFAGWTKAEMVRRAADLGLPDVLADSMSCVHPLRVRGRAKQCGVCPACIGRRQAFYSAGLTIDAGPYLDDIFDPTIPVPREKLDYLAATLMQVIDLEHLTDDGSQPEVLRRHLEATGLLRFGESPGQRVEVLRRYRDEWLRVIHEQHASGQRWAGLLPEGLIAA